MRLVATLLTLHILLLVAWQGIDVGVFYSSFVMRRRGLSVETRQTVRRIMTTLDLAPRVSLILMIPVSLALAYASGWGFAGWSTTVLVPLLWLTTAVGLAWAAFTVWAFLRRRDGSTGSLLLFDRFDWTARAVTSVAFLALGVASLAGHGPFPALWLAWKSTLFGFIVAAGLWIRLAARRYRPHLESLLEHGETEERLARVNASIRGVYPPVLVVWSGLVVMVVLAVAKP